MKKIKLVRLKNDYRDPFSHIKAGVELVPMIRGSFNWKLDNVNYFFSDSEIINNKTDLFEVEYEEERKYIDVRIEYDNFNDNQIGVGDIKSSIENYSLSTHWNFKVTELPEVFSREDMIEFRKYIAEDYHCSDEQNFDYWLSERSNK